MDKETLSFLKHLAGLQTYVEERNDLRKLASKEQSYTQGVHSGEIQMARHVLKNMGIDFERKED